MPATSLTAGATPSMRSRRTRPTWTTARAAQRTPFGRTRLNAATTRRSRRPRPTPTAGKAREALQHPGGGDHEPVGDLSGRRRCSRARQREEGVAQSRRRYRGGCSPGAASGSYRRPRRLDNRPPVGRVLVDTGIIDSPRFALHDELRCEVGVNRGHHCLAPSRSAHQPFSSLPRSIATARSFVALFRRRKRRRVGVRRLRGSGCFVRDRVG